VRFGCVHCHTVFSDGAEGVEAMCRAAFAKGLACLGFSCHAPLPESAGISTHWNMPPGRLEAYLDEVRGAARRWAGRLPVYAGLEADFISGLAGPADSRLQRLGLDFLIGSVHFVVPPRGAPFTVDGPVEEVERGIREGFGGDPRAMAAAYWDAEREMIETGGFDFAGHLDLIKKNNLLPGGGRRWFAEADYAAGARAAADALAAAGLPAEVNTGGLNRGLVPETYPGPALLALLRERGVPVVINSDAHRGDDLDGHYEDTARALAAAGYGEHLLFRGRRDGRAVWERERVESGEPAGRVPSRDAGCGECVPRPR